MMSFHSSSSSSFLYKNNNQLTTLPPPSPLLNIIQLNVNLLHADRLEDHPRVRLHVLWIDILRHFQFHSAHVNVTAQGPEVRLLHGINAGQSSHPLVARGQQRFNDLRRALHQNPNGLLDQTEDTNRDQHGDEHGANGIRDHPAEELHEQGGDDDADGAESVCQDVQEDSAHNLRVVGGGVRLYALHERIHVRMVVVAVIVVVHGVVVVTVSAVRVSMSSSAVGVSMASVRVTVAVLERVDADEVH